MKYMGSKRRIAKDILPIILASRRPEQVYVEPFCGGCNLIDKVPQGAGRIANDNNTYLIALYQHILANKDLPSNIDKELWLRVRQEDLTSFEAWFIAFVRIGCSFGADWNGGYARSKDTKTGLKARNYAREMRDNLLKQAPSLQGIELYSGSYKELSLPERSLIYCDPPYKGATGYKDKFNHEEFYEWCLQKHKEGHTMFISEYEMPEPFIEVWSKAQTTNLDNNRASKQAIERLFTLL